MSGADIRNEITDALAEASAEVGTGAPLIVTLEVPPPGPVDPYDPNGGQPQYHDLNAVQDSISIAHVDGGLIQAQDRRYMVQALDGVSIAPDQKLHVQGKVWQIVRSEPTAQGGLALMWDVIVRGPVGESSL